MDPCSNQTLTLAALGRPFSLGMLYDCRNDHLIPGLTLWDEEALRRDIITTDEPFTDFKVIISDSTADKYSVLNVNGSLKTSCLAGLVKVEGSAKYLKDVKESQNQARVTLWYTITKKNTQLSMNHLGQEHIKYKEVFREGIATHVVTGILYGANAFFVFDREVSSDEDRKDIEGSFKVTLNSIPYVSIGGEVALDKKNTSETTTDKFSCRFHGDVLLENNPVSFQDAMDTYKTLPQKVGEGVPVQVNLLPLKELDPTATQMVCQISGSLVDQWQTALEDLSELEMRCNDAMRSKPVKYFKEINAKVKTFKKLCLTENLKTTLADLLPSIRGGEKEERVLSEFLKKQQEFRFNSNILSECLDRIEREINVVDRFLSMITEDYSQTCSTKIVTSKKELDKEVLNSKVKRVVCFTFTSLGCEDPVLSALDSPSSENTQALLPVKPDLTRWYHYDNVFDDMNKQAGLFKDFAEANKEDTQTRFLSASIPNKEQEGASIYLYENGSIRNEHWEPPSKPEKPTARDRTHNSVTLELLPPNRGAHDVTHYLIEYCIDEKDGWSSEKTSESDAAYTVSGLLPSTGYKFKYRAVCSAGLGPDSEVSDIIKTLPSCPPSKPEIKAYSTELMVCCPTPSVIGQGVKIQNYVVEHKEVPTEECEEEAEWMKRTSKDNVCIIAGLQSLTKYTVRVRYNCGEAGISKWSTPVVIATLSKTTRLADGVKEKSELKHSGSPSVYEIPMETIQPENEVARLRFGEQSSRTRRTIYLVGDKDQVMELMINYILGVQWENGFRFKLPQDDEVSTMIYEINYQDGFQIPFSLTIIYDRQDKCKSIDLAQIRVNALCSVCDAAEFRDLDSEDCKEMKRWEKRRKMLILLTHADGGQLFKHIDPEDIPVHFKFNLSAFTDHARRSHADGDGAMMMRRSRHDVMRGIRDKMREMRSHHDMMKEMRDPHYMMWMMRRSIDEDDDHDDGGGDDDGGDDDDGDDDDHPQFEKMFWDADMGSMKRLFKTLLKMESSCSLKDLIG
ncbi:cytolytic toxin-beta-like [Oncorhynchus tshawytscha]|uniref:Fibronectin type-III domain-containing protein n=1 Tax=Oncorhynchus tshawytscha TaxID=74940 RepID=A0AAZ3RNM1_ONCTS|nr:cytolytic toxin-beta-like [Oncorhynchus tshawytscha]